MFLGAYHFDGDPAALLPAYDRLRAGFPPDIILVHVCLTTANGLTVFDACQTQSEFAGFSSSDEFRHAVKAAGLPEPRVEQLGDVHFAYMKQPVGS